MGSDDSARQASMRTAPRPGTWICDPYTPLYWTKPSAKAERLQAQLEKYAKTKVIDIECALNEAAQQDLIASRTRARWV